MVAAGEQVALEVRPQPVADHRDAAVIHQVYQMVYLLLGQELRLVDDDAGVLFQLLLRRGAHLVEIDAGVLQPDAGVDHVVAVPGIHPGLHQQRLLSPLLIIEPRHQRIGGLAGAHGPVFEVQLCHSLILLRSGCFLCRSYAFYVAVNLEKAVGMGWFSRSDGLAQTQSGAPPPVTSSRYTVISHI